MNTSLKICAILTTAIHLHSYAADTTRFALNSLSTMEELFKKNNLDPKLFKFICHQTRTDFSESYTDESAAQLIRLAMFQHETCSFQQGIPNVPHNLADRIAECVIPPDKHDYDEHLAAVKRKLHAKY